MIIMAEYVKVATMAELPAYSMRKVHVKDGEILLINSNGRVYATSPYCTHEYGPLVDGDLQDDTLMCPLHGAIYNVETGEANTPPAESNLKVFSVKIENGEIFVEV